MVDKVNAVWNLVSSETIRKSWKKLIPLQQPSELQEQSENVDFMAYFIQKFSEIRLEVTRADIANWMNSDGSGYEHLSDQGIVDLVLDTEQETDEDIEDIDHLQPDKCPISNASAMEMFDGCLTWMRYQPWATAFSIASLVQYREMAAEQRASKRQQSSILSFFKKN